ncbi:MAG: 1,2-phenylacetyl-CoA epoxidase subunit PaaC [Phycisphaerae bacterium]
MTQNTIPHKLSRKTKSALVDLLYRLADDNLVLGHRNSEWTGLAPILESDIAFSSMAQDKMGHALTCYKMLHELGEPDPDQLAFLRTPDLFRCCSLVALERGDWALSSVRQFLFDEAAGVRFDALAESDYEPLAQIVRKLRGELKYHIMHGRLAMRRLGIGTDDSHRRMQIALDRLFPHALGIFEPTKWDETLVREGIQPPEADLCKKWRARIAPIIEESSLTLPGNVEPAYGGRVGRHPKTLVVLLDDMQKVYRLDPEAEW